ncbi:MAG: ribonuclease P protein component [bacterium]
MENKKKEKNNRESKLSNRIYSKHFVLAYGYTEYSFGIFFGLSAKSANTVRRNRIKRVFRSLVRGSLGSLVGKQDKDLSICLISKKGIKIGSNVEELRGELEYLVETIIQKIR